jgi:hypothetical protein
MNTRGIREKDFQPITRVLSVQKKGIGKYGTVLCIKHTFN